MCAEWCWSCRSLTYIKIKINSQLFHTSINSTVSLKAEIRFAFMFIDCCFGNFLPLEWLRRRRQRHVRISHKRCQSSCINFSNLHTRLLLALLEVVRTFRWKIESQKYFAFSSDVVYQERKCSSTTALNYHFHLTSLTHLALEKIWIWKMDLASFFPNNQPQSMEIAILDSTLQLRL